MEYLQHTNPAYAINKLKSTRNSTTFLVLIFNSCWKMTDYIKKNSTFWTCVKFKWLTYSWIWGSLRTTKKFSIAGSHGDKKRIKKLEEDRW